MSQANRILRHLQKGKTLALLSDDIIAQLCREILVYNSEILNIFVTSLT